MTKREYIAKHKKSKLAANLSCNNWPDDCNIIIIGGLNTPHDKRSNLYRALRSNNTREYVIGGHRMRGTEGWWFAIKIN